MPGQTKHFHIRADPNMSNQALVQAFLWLKRRAEAAQANGVLWVPDEPYLRGPLTEALGWRLTAVFESEGRLPLGARGAIYCLTETRRPRNFGPVVCILPGADRVESLINLPGPTLIVSDDADVIANWVKLTESVEPAPEDYSPPVEAELEPEATPQGPSKE